MDTIEMVHHDQVTWIERQHGVVEASDMGIRPSRWPALIGMVCAAHRANGNATPSGLVLRRGLVERDADGDITVVHYRSPHGITLDVYND